ncbi:MAG: PstC family ABC transporter permease [Enterobacteriaceae bacterium]
MARRLFVNPAIYPAENCPRVSSRDHSAGWLITLATAITAGSIMLIFLMVLAFALPVVTSGFSSDLALFSWHWSPSQGQFGILPMIAGSLVLAISALCLAWPLALGISCWLLAATDPRAGTFYRMLARLMTLLIRLMTAVPTVIYGFVAVFLLVPLIREISASGSGLCWLTATLVLSLLLLPTLVLVMEAGLRTRFDSIRLTTSTLGFDAMQTLAWLVLPQGWRCLLTALALGFSRGIGDTMLALMLSGNWPQLPLVPGDSLRALTAHMALVTANEVGGMAYNSLFAAGAILLLINAVVSLTLRHLQREAHP